MFAAALAHQGGWDEILLVGAPLLILAAIMRLAKKRADRWAPTAGPGVDAPADATGDQPEIDSDGVADAAAPDLSPDAPPTHPAP